MTSQTQNATTSSCNETNYDYSDFYQNYTYPQEFCWYYGHSIDTLTWIIVCVGLPLTPLAIFLLCVQVRIGHIGQIYVISLHIADLVQVFCMVVHMSGVKDDLTQKIFFEYVYPCGLMASVGFMVCVSMERYLVVAHPLWYQHRRTNKMTVVVCVSVWIISVFVGLLNANIFGALLVLPIPLLFFFLIRTIKAVSASSVPSDEKLRIVAVLVLVVLIYILVFVPRIIMECFYQVMFLFDIDYETLFSMYDITCNLLQLNPLLDLILYFFIKKSIVNKLLGCLCCCKMDSDGIRTSATTT
ncbi:carboxypeptidase N regulatory subunit [Sarotherodon galilaeus]